MNSKSTSLGKLVHVCKLFHTILKKTIDFFLAFNMIATVVILLVGVVMRYVFKNPIFGLEELSIWGLIAMIFLGSTILIRNESHVTITFLTDILGPKPKRVCRVISDVLVLIILSVMIFQSWKVSIRLTESFTPGLGMSEAWYGGVMTVGFVLMLYFKLINFIHSFSRS